VDVQEIEPGRRARRLGARSAPAFRHTWPLIVKSRTFSYDRTSCFAAMTTGWMSREASRRHNSSPTTRKSKSSSCRRSGVRTKVVQMIGPLWIRLWSQSISAIFTTARACTHETSGWREQSPRPLWRRSVRQALSIGPSRGVNMLSDCVANSSRGPCAAPKSRGYKPRFVGSLDALDFVAAETVHQVRRYGHKTVGKRRAWVSRCGLAPRAHTRSARRFPARTLVNR
jgi:hypothetical protein